MFFSKQYTFSKAVFRLPCLRGYKNICKKCNAFFLKKVSNACELSVATKLYPQITLDSRLQTGPPFIEPKVQILSWCKFCFSWLIFRIERSSFFKFDTSFRRELSLATEETYLIGG